METLTPLFLNFKRAGIYDQQDLDNLAFLKYGFLLVNISILIVHNKVITVTIYLLSLNIGELFMLRSFL